MYYIIYALHNIYNIICTCLAACTSFTSIVISKILIRAKYWGLMRWKPKDDCDKSVGLQYVSIIHCYCLKYIKHKFSFGSIHNKCYQIRISCYKDIINLQIHKTTSLYLFIDLPLSTIWNNKLFQILVFFLLDEIPTDARKCV